MVTRTTIKSRMSLKFSQIQPWTAELAALEVLVVIFECAFYGLPLDVGVSLNSRWKLATLLFLWSNCILLSA